MDSSFVLSFILAAAKKKAEKGDGGGWTPAGLPDHWPAQIDLLTWCQNMGPGEACILVVAGLIYLMFGYAIFKALVTLNAMAAGAYLGALIGKNADSVAGGAFVGAVVAAAITYPLLKYAVTFMGGVFGAALGASLWRQANLQGDLAWAGALSGLIFFGMLSMIIFRGSVILYTSLQGAVMLVFGIMSLIYKYKGVGPDLTSMLTSKTFLLPAAVFIPAIIGLLFQQQMYPEEAAAGGGGGKKSSKD